MAYVHPFLDLAPAAKKAVKTDSTTNDNLVAEDNVTPFPAVENQKDYFIERDGKRFAGTHLILDLWGASRLDEIEHIETTLRDAVVEAGATLLHIHLHHFTPNGGVSGVAVLAESHISIHTWPENDFAALDVFMCGAAEPHKTIEVLRRAFEPNHLEVHEYLRGEER
jgi:S-adenosylmethionine decarboxylase